MSPREVVEVLRACPVLAARPPMSWRRLALTVGVARFHLPG